MENILPSSYGTSGATPPLLSVANSNLAIIFEWAALLPLAIYLASSRFPHHLVGQTALTGSICTGLLPRLGVLSSIADFVQHGPDFLDRASSISELRRTVWDVRWGSVFPCANGAASVMLAAHALRGIKVQMLDDTAQHHPNTRASFRRNQTLYTLDFSVCNQDGNTSRDPRERILRIIFEAALLLSLLGACVVTVLFGLFGTSTAILVTILFRLATRLIEVKRPEGYLHSNEADDKAYMLVSLHENASVWYLFKGSRGVVDRILNKAKVEKITSPLGIWLSYGLRVLELLQLLAMTYVASQKGWDGVALLGLVAGSWLYESVVHRENRVVKPWLRREHISITPHAYELSGRTPMIGVIHKLSETQVTSWMDAILTPSSRREVWLSALADSSLIEGSNGLSPPDQEWVRFNKSQTFKYLGYFPNSRPASRGI
ncbi:hypothetical protein E8E14_007614 [Neopestalotiopsis sp. 37M]|nr:hypothetical protein E8E14_007614 [Neopestalotiopsis sp. 37M]